jgi:PAS domain S-box-containing protein
MKKEAGKDKKKRKEGGLIGPSVKDSPLGDVTGRKGMEEELKKSGSLYRTLFEAAGDAIFLCSISEDGDPIFLDLNPRALTMFGGERGDLLGKTPVNISPPAQPDGNRSMVEARKKVRAALEGNPQSFEWKHCRLDGTPFDAEVTLNRIELGGEYHLQGIVRDITIRKRMVEALKKYNVHLEERVRERAAELIEVNRRLSTALDSLGKTETLYHTILEDIPDLICRWKPDGTITFVNENYCRYFGKTKEELIGKSFLPYLVEEDRVRFKEHVAGLNAENPVANFEQRVLFPDGKVRWQQWTNRALIDEHGVVREFQSIGRDITERKRAEHEKERLTAQRIQ